MVLPIFLIFPLLFCSKFKILKLFYLLSFSWNNISGLYHLTGLVHVSEVSWDLVQDVRDILHEGDEVRAKIINVDR